MDDGDQTAVVALLASADTHGGVEVERIDTHAAIVFLAGDRAFKLKRAVRFDYLDFSSVERRRQYCDAELRLNRRTAPSLYRRVVAVTRAPDGTLALEGDGEPVDWVIEMRRFPQDALLDRLAERNALDPALMAPLAAAIARLHRQAEPRPDHGGAAGMSWVVEGNAAGLGEFGTGWLDMAAVSRMTRGARAALQRWASVLDARRTTGFVRQCHGDLHLRNIVVLNGVPTLFDAVEFNDEIACTDVLYDLAFLLMDLWRRRLPGHANALWNRYLLETGTLEGVSLLPLFLSCRAAVRAKTSATTVGVEQDARQREAARSAAREYLGMAESLLDPRPARLIAVGGPSGSGKSTLAFGLAPTLGPVPGAVVLRSDEIRKRTVGVRPLDRLGPDGYTDAVSARVYETIGRDARHLLEQGHAVIVDAVHGRAADRDVLRRIAAEMGVAFTGLWLDAPDTLLTARLAHRTNDPSDADARVLRQQRAVVDPPADWHRLAAAADPDVVLDEARRVLQVAPAS